MKCPLCCECNFCALSEFLQHVRLSHDDKPNFHLQCNLQGCSRTYAILESYRNHIYNYHDTFIIVADHDCLVNLEETSAYTVHDSTSTSDDRNASEEDSAQTGIVDMQKASALWILKTLELYQLPLSIMM